MVLAKLANLALSSLLQTEYFTSAADNPKIDRQEIARVGTGPQKVGSYSKSRWLVDNPGFEMRMAYLTDLETEIETI